MESFKKKLFFAILILLITLTGCNNGSGMDTENKSEQGSEVQGTEPEDGTEEVIKQKSAVLEDAQQLNDMILYIQNEKIESGLQQQIGLYNNNLLLWGHGQNSDGEISFCLSLISLQTGEVLQEKSFAEMELPNVQICGDKIAVTDWAKGEVFLLDSQFQVTAEYETGTQYCTIYLNAEAANIYCFTQEGVKVINTKTDSTEMLFEEAAMLYASSHCGDTVSVTYTDKNTQLNVGAVVDMAAGTAEFIPFDGAFYNIEYNNGIWMAGVLGEDNMYYLGKSDRPNSFKPPVENSMVTLLADPARLMSTDYDENGTPGMVLYDLDGRFLSLCKLPIEGAVMSFEPIWSENDGGYFFLVTDLSGKDMLLFWDLSAPVAGEDLQLKSEHDGDSETGSAVSQELYDRAEEISEKYDVEIVIGDQAEEEYESFFARHELDEEYIAAGLESVETALSKYPEDFMRQLLYSNQKELEIHLTGTFTMLDMPEGEVNGFTSYAGLAEEQEGKTVIAMDITLPGSLEQTLHHEIMHVIDHKLAFDASLREDALYSEDAWNKLNPEDFRYTETKTNLPDHIFNDGYESYFIDLYSRTFAGEDRARIMEYAMIEADWTFSASEGRWEKLEYLCECIRDSFDTEGWPDETIWEKTLKRSMN